MTMESGAPTQNLNVAADETAIYEGGQLTAFTKKDLLGNEAALAQLINAHNLAIRERERLKRELERMRIEQAATILMPVVTICFSVLNVIAALMIGIGSNFYTQSPRPSIATWLLGLGALIAVVVAIIQPLMPWILKKMRKENHAADQ